MITMLIRVWLVFLAAFELGPIYTFGSSGGTPSQPPTGFSSGMTEVQHRRLWAFMLALLVLARLAAAADPHSVVARIHCAAVHCAEALYMGTNGSMGAQQRGPIWMAMLFNAVLFSGWAVSLLIPSGAGAAAAA